MAELLFAKSFSLGSALDLRIFSIASIVTFVIAMLAVGAARNAAPLFQDVTASTGIRFILENSATPEKHQIETMVGGVAVFDFDNDGLPDVYFVNGAEQPSLKKTSPRYSNRLYRNKGNFEFEDVTEKAGLSGTGYDIGAATGDFDNDGNTDLFITGVHGNTLFRNRGDGTFEDVTRKAGLESTEWAVSAAWIDYDNDGRLDLFVVNYVKWDPAREPFCGDSKNRTYCHPRFYEPLSNRLYHNNGDGTFTDVSVSSGIAAFRGKGMGIAIADYDADGWMDIFVANDTEPNWLFHNNRNGKFTEVGLESGVALNDEGKAVSSMGADFRDLDNDGREDLFITALTNETFPLFRNQGHGLFREATYSSRLGQITLPFSGWSIGLFDFDNDGWKDVFIANGDVQDNTERYSDRQSRQQNLLLLNHRGSFEASRVGVPAMYRGAAFGDFDGDGRVDVVVTRIHEPAVVFRNVSDPGNYWLTLKLIGSKSNRSAIGARVTLTTAAGTQVNHATTAVGYASASDLAVHFGLGQAPSATRIEIEWPSGTKQRLSNVGVNKRTTVTEPPATEMMDRFR